MFQKGLEIETLTPQDLATETNPLEMTEDTETIAHMGEETETLAEIEDLDHALKIEEIETSLDLKTDLTTTDLRKEKEHKCTHLRRCSMLRFTQ